MKPWLASMAVILGAVFGVVAILSLPVQVSAHEGHEHQPVSMKKAVGIALSTAHAASLKPLPALALPQLDASWRELPEAAAQIVENGRGYYWVKVDNAAQAKSLYVRILLDGQVDAANFSGASVPD
ncbi:DUF6488 family protein [Cellvibrio sp. NN19]|uniref:DUF6488 family protein n=1 Tax=Cellvibrio chitinivorans TaxID=3102792 RepID=UPI002B4179DD|nr:DUF6488 family protein [Cellvibrio sp. NN19]